MLGFVWTLLNPLLMLATLGARLRAPLQDRSQNYAVFLFAGMVPWTFLSGSLNDCAICIISNEGLIRKIYLPKLIFPLVRGC